MFLGTKSTSPLGCRLRLWNGEVGHGSSGFLGSRRSHQGRLALIALVILISRCRDSSYISSVTALIVIVNCIDSRCSTGTWSRSSCTSLPSTVPRRIRWIRFGSLFSLFLTLNLDDWSGHGHGLPLSSFLMIWAVELIGRHRQCVLSWVWVIFQFNVENSKF